MNSSPENPPSPATNKNSSSSDSEAIGDLIDFLLELENPSQDSLSEAKTAIDHPDLSSEDDGFLGADLAQDLVEQSNAVDEDLAGTEIEVEIESVSKPTLEEAVEYQAFLQQTLKPEKIKPERLKPERLKPETTVTVSEIANLKAINTEKASPEDLADAVNTLITPC